MMDAGYFVGRKEIVDWVNETLQLSLSKVEQTASGAVACQLLDRIYPGKVPLSKVNWDSPNWETLPKRSSLKVKSVLQLNDNVL